MINYIYYTYLAYKIYENSYIIDCSFWSAKQIYHIYKWMTKREYVPDINEDWILIDDIDSIVIENLN